MGKFVKGAWVEDSVESKTIAPRSCEEFVADERMRNQIQFMMDGVLKLAEMSVDLKRETRALKLDMKEARMELRQSAILICILMTMLIILIIAFLATLFIWVKA
jgi:hypothetical protein